MQEPLAHRRPVHHATEHCAEQTIIIVSLSKIPGLDTGSNSGRNMWQSFTLRGFEHGTANCVIVLQHGVRRSANLFSNQMSSFRMDADLIKHVEVVRGASAISYGGGAIGGVMGTSTKDASDFILPSKEVGEGHNLYISLSKNF